MTDRAEFVTVPLADGGEWTRLDRLTDGRIMCQLCFGYVTRQELNPTGDGQVEDVCKPCAQAEAEAVRRRNTQERS